MDERIVKAYKNMLDSSDFDKKKFIDNIETALKNELKSYFYLDSLTTLEVKAKVVKE